MPTCYPVIVVPGITATYLHDQYPLPPETIWSVLQKDYERAALHPDNVRFEAQEPARIVSDQVYEIAYKELIAELRHNLSDKADDPVSVYAFGYDWRRPLASLDQQLRDFVEEVIERTKLQRNYFPAYAASPKVNLIGHSMGGLIIAGYLDRFGGEGRVHKVVSLAAPFQGSFEALIKITTGTANLGGDVPSSREREAARLTPALYHLLPSDQAGIEVDPGLPQPHSLFNAALWQPSIAATIDEFIRIHGVDKNKSPADRAAQAQRLLAEFLQAAAVYRARVSALNLVSAGLTARDWLAVVGVDAETRCGLHIANANGAASFDLSSRFRANKWRDADATERRKTGDGTVPFAGAIPRFLPYESLVCVSPDDFGYWEIADRAATQLAGFHGMLPNMNMLHRLIVCHLTGRPTQYANIWGRLPPGISQAAWVPPIAGLAPKSP